jgi:hypothetical protein
MKIYEIWKFYVRKFLAILLQEIFCMERDTRNSILYIQPFCTNTGYKISNVTFSYTLTDSLIYAYIKNLNYSGMCDAL